METTTAYIIACGIIVLFILILALLIKIYLSDWYINE